MLGQVGLIEQRPDARVRADHTLRPGLDVNTKRGDAANFYLFDLEVEIVDGEGAKRVPDRIDVGTGMDQRRKRHVSGDARETVEIGQAHGISGLSRGEGGRRDLAHTPSDSAKPHRILPRTTGPDRFPRGPCTSPPRHCRSWFS